MESTNQTFGLELTAAVVIDGEICNPGEVVELTKPEAENLLHRGMAKLANPEQLKALEDAAAEDAERIRKENEAAIEKQKADNLVADPEQAPVNKADAKAKAK